MNDLICTEVRSWLGTPYHHQASVKGVGCDCLGLIRGVWRGVYGDEPEAMPAYSPEWAEAGGVETLLQAAQRHLVEIPSPLAGEGARRADEGFSSLREVRIPPSVSHALDSSPARGEQRQTLARDIIAGDVLLFRMRPRALVKHAGIYLGDGQFIHAYEHAGVVAQDLSEFWRSKIAAVFGFQPTEE